MEETSPVLADVVEKLARRASPLEPIGGRVLLDCGEQGILIEGGQAPLRVQEAAGDEAVDCRVRLKLALLNDILDGRRKAFMAFATGKIRISGDMSVAVKLQPMLSG